MEFSIKKNLFRLILLFSIFSNIKNINSNQNNENKSNEEIKKNSMFQGCTNLIYSRMHYDHVIFEIY